MKLKFAIISAVLLVMGSSNVFAADAAYKIQQKMIFNPSAHMIEAEVMNNRVYIYEGMKLADVERAMDEQFDRIERMMFVKTRYVSPETGRETSEEDSCD